MAGMFPMLCTLPKRRCLSRTVRGDKLHVGQKVGVYIKVVRHAQGAVKLVDAWRGGSSSKDHFSPCGTSSCRVLRTKTRETEKGTGNEGAGWSHVLGRPSSFPCRRANVTNKLFESPSSDSPRKDRAARNWVSHLPKGAITLDQGLRDRGDSRLAEDVLKEDVLRPRPAIAGHPSTSRHDSIEHATSSRPLQFDSSLRDPVDPHLIQRPLFPGTVVGSEDPHGSKESLRLEDLVSDDPRNPRILRLDCPKGNKKKKIHIEYLKIREFEESKDFRNRGSEAPTWTAGSRDSKVQALASCSAVFEDPRGFLLERENKSAFHANYLSCDHGVKV
ncbi:hypothetical protein G5I_01143 [Acromyrmex echinatior]|uniref:Uncharacterized protein n=1 Tax=Acromyrmex echinatior TaxID=103372 RepID=F4W6T8_ACREC|nr:hypothetical protein G5I_01143 [Acromyrmex echinatior]